MIRTCFDLASSHVRADTMNQLSVLTPEQRIAKGWPAMTVAKHLHGVFVTVPDQPEEIDYLPHDLAYVLGHARNYGVMLVHIHSDGNEVPDLDVYPW